MGVCVWVVGAAGCWCGRGVVGGLGLGTDGLEEEEVVVVVVVVDEEHEWARFLSLALSVFLSSRVFTRLDDSATNDVDVRDVLCTALGGQRRACARRV